MKSENLVIVFHIVCLLTTASLLCFCCWKYLQDESTSLVEFQTFHNTKKDIYPSISFCFWGRGIYYDERLNQRYGIENVSDYMKFLQGNHWKNQMLKVEYDSTTIDLKDHVNGVGVFNRRWEPLYGWNLKSANRAGAENTHENTFPFYTSHRHSTVKCFSLDLVTKAMPGIDGNIISVVWIQFSNIVMQNVQMSYSMHYPGQFLRGMLMDFDDSWNISITSGIVKSKLYLVDMVEVIRRRNTYQTQCHEDSENDDEMILKDVVESAKCRPPQWKFKLQYPICNDSGKMKKVYIESPIPRQSTSTFLKEFVQPCDQVKMVMSTIREGTQRLFSDIVSENKNTSARVLIVFRNEDYREIKHKRDFNFEGLVGNMGGYVGLLLGSAFWQLPDTIRFVVNILKTKYKM